MQMKQQQRSPGQSEQDKLNPANQRSGNQMPQRDSDRQRQEGQGTPQRGQPDQPQPKPQDEDQS